MTNSNPSSTGATQTHADGTSSKQPPSSNPIGDSFNVVVTVPEVIKIKMVDASALSDYEVWIFLASVSSSAAIGFLVAYYQALDGIAAVRTYVGWTDVLCIVLFATFFVTALFKRHALQRKGREIKLQTSSVSVGE